MDCYSFVIGAMPDICPRIELCFETGSTSFYKGGLLLNCDILKYRTQVMCAAKWNVPRAPQYCHKCFCSLTFQHTFRKSTE